MNTIRGKALAATLVAVMCLICAGSASSQALTPAFVGKFTLTAETHWGRTVLSPGTYTITIVSKRSPVTALIRNENGDAVTYIASGARHGNASGLNALLIGERHGQLTVHSLALAEWGTVLVFDRSLANEKTQLAETVHSVPVGWAKE